MNKTIGIIVAIIVIAGGAYLFMNAKPKTTQPKGDTSSTATAQSTSENSSLKALLAAGKSQKCTFTSSENGTTSEGTFYISGGKSRGDISAVVAGKTSTTHMIYDNTTSYVWMDDSTTGFKMAVNADQAKDSSDQSQSQGVDPNKDYKYSCSGWSADNSKFQTPSNVEFKDFSVPTIPVSSSSSAGTTTGLSADQICGSLSGSAKDQCIASLQKK